MALSLEFWISIVSIFALMFEISESYIWRLVIIRLHQQLSVEKSFNNPSDLSKYKIFHSRVCVKILDL